MRQKTANDARRAGVLVLVALLHLGLLWLLINSTSSYQIVRNVSTLVRLIEPEPVKRKLGATLKSPVITPSIFILPKVEPPKVVVMIVKPTPQAPPAPAPVAVASGSSAPSLGDTTPPAAIPPDDFSAYVKLIHNRMQATLDDIASRRISQLPGSVIVAMEIDRTGKIMQWEIEGGRHPPWLEFEIRQLMQQSDPLPPFPASIRAQRSGFEIPVNFAASGMLNGF